MVTTEGVKTSFAAIKFFVWAVKIAKVCVITFANLA